MSRGKDKVKKRTFRAGKRKCVRCKKVWYREKGDRHFNCPRCQAHCPRCDVKLTEDDLSAKSIRNSYKCRKCVNEIAAFSINKLDHDKERRRDWKLSNDFGITAVEYDAILEYQKGACRICKSIPKPGKKRLAVDHRHVPKDNQQNPRDTRTRVRGLLCWGCNAALGKFKDSIELLEAAAAYLKEVPAQKILNKEKTDE